MEALGNVPVLRKEKASRMNKLNAITIYNNASTKGGFFSESAIRFFKSPNLQKKYIPNNYPELEIWICCLLLLAGNLR